MTEWDIVMRTVNAIWSDIVGNQSRISRRLSTYVEWKRYVAIVFVSPAMNILFSKLRTGT